MKRETRPHKSKSSPSRTEFARRLIRWQRRHGRDGLPWQAQRTLYRVWVSEIMLQQTQVATVIPYFTRFTARFPTVRRLAAADLDAVLHLWSGLGYYARARNLHRAAKEIWARHGGEMPANLEDLMDLPGIGRSTAGAILALGANRPFPILDGNAKRVLCRHFAIAGWPGKKAVQEQLWDLAASLVPRRNARTYTQAIMDLGATICTRTRPDCVACPVGASCLARRRGLQAQLPERRPRAKLPTRRAIFAMIRNKAGAILLERRPEAGVWGGLWSLPECPGDADPGEWVKRRFHLRVERCSNGRSLRHTFTHFHLDIRTVHIQARDDHAGVGDIDNTLWYNPAARFTRGIATPVRKLIEDLNRNLRGGDS